MIISLDSNVSTYEAFSLDMMMGYLLYDIMIEYLTTRQLDTLGHHGLGLVSHMSCRLSNNAAGAFYRFTSWLLLIYFLTVYCNIV